MKKYISITITALLSVCFLLIFFTFLCVYFFPIFPLKSPVIPSDKKWYSSVNNLSVESNYDSDFQGAVLSGTLMIDDEIIDLEIGTRAGRLFFYCDQYEQFSLIMTADYKLNKEGNIVLKKIHYNEEVDWQETPKKIILEEQKE